MVRLGIIACSSVARRRLLPALAESSSMRLERTGSRDAGRARDFAETFGCAKYGSYEEVLADPDVDAVYISTPPSAHEEWCLRAADAGKHILCEKPAAISLAGARRISESCRTKRVCFLEGFMFRFHPQHRLINDALYRESAIGPVRMLDIVFTYPEPPPGDIRLRPDLAGGVFFDAAGYTFAAAQLQKPGEPVAVSAYFEKDPAHGVDRAVSAIIEYNSGATARLYSAFGVAYESRYTVYGSEGILTARRAFAMPPDHVPVFAIEKDDEEQTFSAPACNQFLCMLDQFAAAIEDASRRPAFLDDFIEVHRLMDAALASSGSGRRVSLST